MVVNWKIAIIGLLPVFTALVSGLKCHDESDPNSPFVYCYYTGEVPLRSIGTNKCTHLIFTDGVTTDSGYNLNVTHDTKNDLKMLEDAQLQKIFTLNLEEDEALEVLKSSNRSRYLISEITKLLQITLFDGVELNFRFTEQTKNQDFLKNSYSSFAKNLEESLTPKRRRTKREQEDDEAASTDITTELLESTINTTETTETSTEEKFTTQTEEPEELFSSEPATEDSQTEKAATEKDVHDDIPECSEFSIIVRVSVHPNIIGKIYDFKTLSRHVDVFSVATHEVSESDKHLTYHPSRLMGLSDASNTDSILDFLLGLGARKSKIVISLPATALKFQLKDEDKNTPGSATVGKPESINQSDLCSLLKKGKWTLERDEDLTAPYAFSGRSWLAFEDEISVNIKGKYIVLRELAGGAIYPIDADINNEACSNKTGNDGYLTSILRSNFKNLGRKPRALVLESLRNEIHDSGYSRAEAGVKVSEYRIVRVVDYSGAVHVIRKNTKTNFECSRQGYFSHPLGCNKFYRCVKFDQYSDEFTVFEYNCPDGLAFDERWEVCVWPGSLPNGAPCTGSSEIAPVPRAHYQCPNQEGYYSDPENCRWFFACLDHARDGITPLTAYEFRCPFGLVFNEEKLACDWPWLVESCGNRGASGFLSIQSGNSFSEVQSNTFLETGSFQSPFGVYGENQKVLGSNSYSGDIYGYNGARLTGDRGGKAYQTDQSAAVGYIFNPSSVDGNKNNDRGAFGSIPEYEISGGRILNKGGVVLKESVVFDKPSPTPTGNSQQVFGSTSGNEAGFASHEGAGFTTSSGSRTSSGFNSIFGTESQFGTVQPLFETALDNSYGSQFEHGSKSNFGSGQTDSLNRPTFKPSSGSDFLSAHKSQFRLDSKTAARDSAFHTKYESNFQSTYGSGSEFNLGLINQRPDESLDLPNQRGFGTATNHNVLQSTEIPVFNSNRNSVNIQNFEQDVYNKLSTLADQKFLPVTTPTTKVVLTTPEVFSSFKTTTTYPSSTYTSTQKSINEINGQSKSSVTQPILDVGSSGFYSGLGYVDQVSGVGNSFGSSGTSASLSPATPTRAGFNNYQSPDNQYYPSLTASSAGKDQNKLSTYSSIIGNKQAQKPGSISFQEIIPVQQGNHVFVTQKDGYFSDNNKVRENNDLWKNNADHGFGNQPFGPVVTPKSQNIEKNKFGQGRDRPKESLATPITKPAFQSNGFTQSGSFSGESTFGLDSFKSTSKPDFSSFNTGNDGRKSLNQPDAYYETVNIPQFKTNFGQQVKSTDTNEDALSVDQNTPVVLPVAITTQNIGLGGNFQKNGVLDQSDGFFGNFDRKPIVITNTFGQNLNFREKTKDFSWNALKHGGAVSVNNVFQSGKYATNDGSVSSFGQSTADLNGSKDFKSVPISQSYFGSTIQNSHSPFELPNFITPKPTTLNLNPQTSFTPRLSTQVEIEPQPILNIGTFRSPTLQSNGSKNFFSTVGTTTSFGSSQYKPQTYTGSTTPIVPITSAAHSIKYTSSTSSQPLDSHSFTTTAKPVKKGQEVSSSELRLKDILGSINLLTSDLSRMQPISFQENNRQGFFTPAAGFGSTSHLGSYQSFGSTSASTATYQTTQKPYLEHKIEVTEPNVVDVVEITPKVINYQESLGKTENQNVGLYQSEAFTPKNTIVTDNSYKTSFDSDGDYRSKVTPKPLFSSTTAQVTQLPFLYQINRQPTGKEQLFTEQTNKINANTSSQQQLFRQQDSFQTPKTVYYNAGASTQHYSSESPFQQYLGGQENVANGNSNFALPVTTQSLFNQFSPTTDKSQQQFGYQSINSEENSFGINSHQSIQKPLQQFYQNKNNEAYIANSPPSEYSFEKQSRFSGGTNVQSVTAIHPTGTTTLNDLKRKNPSGTTISVGSIDTQTDTNGEGVEKLINTGEFSHLLNNEGDNFNTKLIRGNGRGRINFGSSGSSVQYEVTGSKGEGKTRGRQYHGSLVSEIPATNKYEEYEIESWRSFNSGKNNFGSSKTTIDLKNIPTDKNKKTVIIVSQVSDANPILVGKLAGQCSCQSNLLEVKDKGRRSRNRISNDNNNQGGSVPLSKESVDRSGTSTAESRQIEGSTRFDPYLNSPTSKQLLLKTTQRSKVSRGKARYLPPPASSYDDPLFSPVPASTIVHESADGSDNQIFDRYGPGGWRSFDETLQGSIDCKRSGLFRHPKYCNKFYACNYDPWEEKFTLHVFNCPIRLTYDSSISACNWPVGGPACANDNLLV